MPLQPLWEPSAKSRHHAKTIKTPLFWKPKGSLTNDEIFDWSRNKRSLVVMRQSALYTRAEKEQFSSLQKNVSKIPFRDVLFGKEATTGRRLTMEDHHTVDKITQRPELILEAFEQNHIVGKEMLRRFLQTHPAYLDQYIEENFTKQDLERFLIHQTRGKRKSSFYESRRSSEGSQTSMALDTIKDARKLKWKKLKANIEEIGSGNEPIIKIFVQVCESLYKLVRPDEAHFYVMSPNKEDMILYVGETARTGGLNTFKAKVGTNIAAYVGASSHGVLVQRVGQRDYRFPLGAVNFVDESVRSVIAQPMFDLNGSLQAVFVLGRSGTSLCFQEADADVVGDFLLWTGMGIYSAEMFMGLSWERNVNEFLLEIVESLFTTNNIEDVVGKILRYGKQLIQCDRVSLFLLDRRKNQLYAKLFEQDEGDVLEKTEDINFTVSKGIAGYCALNGVVANVSDAYEDPRFNREIDQRMGYHTTTILAIPIFAQHNFDYSSTYDRSKRFVGSIWSKNTAEQNAENRNYLLDDDQQTTTSARDKEVVGVIQLINKDKGCFNQKDERIMQVFASYCGLAIYQAKITDKLWMAERRKEVFEEMLMYHTQASWPRLLAARRVELTEEGKAALKTFDFYDPLMPSDTQVACVVHMINDLTGDNLEFSFDEETVWLFFLTVRNCYRELLYHNWAHGFKVTQAAYAILKRCSHRFKPLESVIMLISCACHDIDHRGRTNLYMAEHGTALAALYPNSVMEQHHFRFTVQLLQNQRINIFNRFSLEDLRSVMYLMKTCILATDMANLHKNRQRLASLTETASFDWENPHHRRKLMVISMNCCDLSASYQTVEGNRANAFAVVEEFWEQGDEDRLMGKPVDMMFDRELASDMPVGQIGFLQNVALPLLQLEALVLPEFAEPVKLCKANIHEWQAFMEDPETGMKHKEARSKATEELKKMLEMVLTAGSNEVEQIYKYSKYLAYCEHVPYDLLALMENQDKAKKRVLIELPTEAQGTQRWSLQLDAMREEVEHAVFKSRPSGTETITSTESEASDQEEETQALPVTGALTMPRRTSFFLSPKKPTQRSSFAPSKTLDNVLDKIHHQQTRRSFESLRPNVNNTSKSMSFNNVNI